MANFPPLKNHILYCVDRLIEDYGLQAPFLDVGCGRGDVAAHLGRRGWQGRAIDRSEQAVERARRHLAGCAGIAVDNVDLHDVEGTYRTILLMDVIEHLPDDMAALRRVHTLLEPGGHAVLSVPSHPREWRWDDEFYGHVRRYDPDDLCRALRAVGLEPVLLWDFTFPVFWAMRRLYTRLKRPPREPSGSAQTRTENSSLADSWTIPLVSRLLCRDHVLWRGICRLQFRLFRANIKRGHEILALARKT